jgi:hypothetical protein
VKRRYVFGLGDQAANARRRRALPAMFDALRALTRSRIVVILFLSVLALDLASSGFCCLDTPIGSSASAISASGPLSSDTAPHVDDNCFCCARSVATPIYVWGSLEALAFATHGSRQASQLPDLPPPYHPPQARA